MPKREPPEPPFRPFADEAAVLSVGGLSFENGAERIAVHGSLDLTRDRAGLERALTLKSAVDAIVEALRVQDLPEAVAESAQATKRVSNPFA